MAPTAFNRSRISGVLWCFVWAGATGAGAGAGAGAAGAGAGAAGAAGAGIGAAGAGAAAGLFTGWAGGCIIYFLLIISFSTCPNDVSSA
ncbi:MAG TPA: hypothetical protein EYN46_04035 [Candidatus Poseidoniales archaeon]|nr:hypothetical protein [Candidatus Poseidoniales archaeon]